MAQRTRSGAGRRSSSDYNWDSFERRRRLRDRTEQLSRLPPYSRPIEPPIPEPPPRRSWFDWPRWTRDNVQSTQHGYPASTPELFERIEEPDVSRRAPDLLPGGQEFIAGGQQGTMA